MNVHIPNAGNKVGVVIGIGNIIAAATLIATVILHSSDADGNLATRVAHNETAIQNLQATNQRQDQAINDLQVRSDAQISQLDAKISKVDDKATQILEIVASGNRTAHR